MARCQIIAELATNHGGNLLLALDMISAAADSGADIVKTQGYQIKHLRKTDPQYEWFKQCELSRAAHETLKAHAESCGVQYLSTAFHQEDLQVLKDCGLRTVKIGSGEGRSDLPRHALDMGFKAIVTTAWGASPVYEPEDLDRLTMLGTVPLYPAPAECYAKVFNKDGYSDHHVGLDIARLAVASRLRVLEKHFHIPDRGCREQAWNMTPEDLKELRRWTETCAKAFDGTAFEGRWTA